MCVYNAVSSEAQTLQETAEHKELSTPIVQRKLSPLKLSGQPQGQRHGRHAALDTIAAVAELKAMVNKGLVSYRLFIAEKG